MPSKVWGFCGNQVQEVLLFCGVLGDLGTLLLNGEAKMWWAAWTVGRCGSEWEIMNCSGGDILISTGLAPGRVNTSKRMYGGPSLAHFRSNWENTSGPNMNKTRWSSMSGCFPCCTIKLSAKGWIDFILFLDQSLKAEMCPVSAVRRAGGRVPAQGKMVIQISSETLYWHECIKDRTGWQILPAENLNGFSRMSAALEVRGGSHLRILFQSCRKAFSCSCVPLKWQLFQQSVCLNRGCLPKRQRISNY